MFKPAVRKQARLRLGLMGPPGSGKTYTALLLAKHLGAKKVAVIDSERGSAKLYSDLVPFEVCELESFAAERYIEAIQFAERNGFDVLVIDSLSHAWSGKDGILEYKDKQTAASKSRDSFGAGWRDATPLHNKLVDAILSFKGHVIATLRTKTEYVIEEGANGKKYPRKVGMAPIQRDGVEYEFTVVGDFVDPMKLAITKTRCPTLTDAVILKPGREMAEALLEWLNLGEPEAEPAPEAPPEKSPERIAAEATCTRGVAKAEELAAALGAEWPSWLTLEMDALPPEATQAINAPGDASDAGVKAAIAGMAKIIGTLRTELEKGKAA
jgi:hypothetical protein